MAQTDMPADRTCFTLSWQDVYCVMRPDDAEFDDSATLEFIRDNWEKIGIHYIDALHGDWSWEDDSRFVVEAVRGVGN